MNINDISGFFYLPLVSLFFCWFLAGLALIKGKFSKENVLFALVCIWYSLLSIPFMSHHLFNDEEVILKIERSTHLIYVFIPFVTVVFSHFVMGIKRRWLEILTFILSLGISCTTFSKYYINGLYKYSWGYIAKGEITFQIFGIYCILTVLYGGFEAIRTLRHSKDPAMRSKIKYIISSFILMAIMTCFNIPAMQGIDFYPIGNLMFIPLVLMAYGLLRYRLLDIQSMLHMSFIWLLTSSIVLLPNLLLFVLTQKKVKSLATENIFIILAFLCLINIIYIKTVQKKINKLFNREKFNLQKKETAFFSEMIELRTITDLIDQIEKNLSEVLNLRNIKIFLFPEDKEDKNTFITRDQEKIILSQTCYEFLKGKNEIIDLNIVQTDKTFEKNKKELLSILQDNDAHYIFVISDNFTIYSLILTSQKIDLKHFKKEERNFIASISNSTIIALSNSFTYQKLEDAKSILKEKVEKRSNDLEAKNKQMNFELNVAQNVQLNILPDLNIIPDDLPFCSIFKPFSSVSSDFYYISPIKNGNIFFALYEVSAKGVPPALLTTIITTEFQNIMANEDATNLIAQKLNEKLFQILQETSLTFNIFIGALNLKDLQLTYTNCNMEPPLIFTMNKDISYLPNTSPAIGEKIDSFFENNSYSFNAHDRLYLPTTAMLKTVGSMENLANFLKDHASESLAKQKELLLKNFDQEKIVKDDLTLLAIEPNFCSLPLEKIGLITELLQATKYDEIIQLYNEQDSKLFTDLDYYILSKSYLRVGNYEKALEFIEIARQFQPDNIEFLYYQGIIFLNLKDEKQALTLFKQVAEFDSGYKKCKLYIKKLSKELSKD